MVSREGCGCDLGPLESGSESREVSKEGKVYSNVLCNHACSIDCLFSAPSFQFSLVCRRKLLLYSIISISKASKKAFDMNIQGHEVL